MTNYYIWHHLELGELVGDGVETPRCRLLGLVAFELVDVNLGKIVVAHLILLGGKDSQVVVKVASVINMNRGRDGRIGPDLELRADLLVPREGSDLPDRRIASHAKLSNVLVHWFDVVHTDLDQVSGSGLDWERD